jgi:hypothetical protein
MLTFHSTQYHELIRDWVISWALTVLLKYCSVALDIFSSTAAEAGSERESSNSTNADLINCVIPTVSVYHLSASFGPSKDPLEKTYEHWKRPPTETIRRLQQWFDSTLSMKFLQWHIS